MQCPRCEHENRSLTKFCEECGTSLTGSKQDGPPAASYADLQREVEHLTRALSTGPRAPAAPCRWRLMLLGEQRVVDETAVSLRRWTALEPANAARDGRRTNLMSWKTSLAVVATSLILAGTAAAQTPGAGPGGMGPASPGATPAPGGPTTPGTPGGSTTPRMPGSTTPGVPGTTTPGMSDPTPGVACPPGQARRPGSSICMPATPGVPLPPPTR